MVRNITEEEFVRMINSGEDFIPINVNREDVEEIRLISAVCCPVNEISDWVEKIWISDGKGLWYTAAPIVVKQF